MIIWVFATFLVACGGLLYEIFLGSFGSYLFGDSVKIFSLTTGVYMFAMGLGAFSIKPDVKKPLERLFQLEVGLVLLHLLSPLLIWFFFGQGAGASPVFWTCLLLSGYLVGAEIPLILAVFRQKEGSSDSRIHQILASDYVGALVASLVFGFYLLPQMGLFSAAAFAAASESAGVLLVAWYERKNLKRAMMWLTLQTALLVVSLAVLAGSGAIQRAVEGRFLSQSFLDEKIIVSEWTGFSFLTLIDYTDPATKQEQKLLLLDRQHQWSTQDLVYYHEILTIPVMETWKRASGRSDPRVLIIGGGDGFAADQLHRYYGVKDITLVDIDPRISELAQSLDFWRERGGHVFQEGVVDLHHEDAFQFVRTASTLEKKYDVVIMDLPDPNSPALARFFTPFFFEHLKKSMNPNGQVSIQASFTPSQRDGRRKSACMVEATLRDRGFVPQTLIGDESDFYILGTLAEKFHWPEDNDDLPGQIFKKGRRVKVMTVDAMDWLGPNCPAQQLSHLLHPTFLEL